MQMEDDYGMIDGIVNNGAKQPEKLEKNCLSKPQMTGVSAPPFSPNSANIRQKTNKPQPSTEVRKGTKYDELQQ